jgi:hypothetical protein
MTNGREAHASEPEARAEAELRTRAMTDLNAEKEAAYAKYLAAWVDVANMPGPEDRSVAQEAEAQHAQRRLDQATLDHYEACLAARDTPETEAERGGRHYLEERIELDREREAEAEVAGARAMTPEPETPRWSPEVLAANDFPAIAERVAEREARREAEGAASRAAWAALTPAEQEAELARCDAEYEVEFAERVAKAEAEREIEDPEAEIG